MGDPHVHGVYTGAIAEPWPGKGRSAIAKTPRQGPVMLTALGLEGDAQADLEAHGGLDKAAHLYPVAHYAHWRAVYPERAQALIPGGVGETLSIVDLTEADVCLGDVLAIGQAVLEVSHGRQPCWKLDAHLGLRDMAYRFRKTGRTGWYCRVLEPGTLSAGAVVRLVERPCPRWPLDRLIAAKFDPRLAKETAAELAALAPLAEAWRSGFAERAARPD